MLNQSQVRAIFSILGHVVSHLASPAAHSRARMAVEPLSGAENHRYRQRRLAGAACKLRRPVRDQPGSGWSFANPGRWRPPVMNLQAIATVRAFDRESSPASPSSSPLKTLADKLDIAASESEIRRQARSMSDAEIIQSLERTQVPMLRRLINLFRRIRLLFSKT